MKAAAVINGQAPERTEPPAPPAFAELERQAAAIEADAAPGGELGPAAPAAIDNAAELLDALKVARLVVKPMFAWWPDFAATWTDEALQAIADGGGQVMTKHGWTMGGLFNEFGPYLALGVATVPPVMVTWKAINDRKAALAAAPVASAPTDAPNQ